MQATPHIGRGETVAKIILMGEHAVVYGHPAIALPLRNLPMAATAAPVDGESRLDALDYHGALANAPERFSSIRRAIDVAMEFAGLTAPLQIATRSSIPAERGLGSSAAAAGAVIRAILDLAGTPASHQQLFELTQQAERVAHGRPSGLDAMTTSSLVPVRFQSGSAEPIAIQLTAWIVIADTGVHGRTRETVGHIRDLLEREPAVTTRLLDKLGRLAEESTTSVRTGDVERFGAQMDAAQRILSRLGVSDATLDTLVAAARQAGAVGAKLTGGGRGGCMYALAPTASSASVIAQALTNAGAARTLVYAPHAYEAAA